MGETANANANADLSPLKGIRDDEQEFFSS
jgi:hypothetical protein